MSGRRRWVFRLAAVVLVPLVGAALLEGGLRLGGYGYRTSFFKPQKIGQEDCLVENDKFGLRFFPPELARSPAPVVMKAHKAPGSRRIFILGESAALGDPRPAYGAGRYLEALLRERFPQGQFEVVCVAMTAINSHAIREIARECEGREGDLWILYLGNNEMIGPFGATGVIGARAPSLGIVRFNLALQRTRLGQLLLSTARRLKHAPAEGAWAGMEMWVKNHVPPADPRREAVYVNFSANLRAVLNEARRTKVILSTMAVNLKDCPPLATDSGTVLTADDQVNSERLEREAAGLEESDPAKAATLLAQAARLNPRRADLQYKLAGRLLAGGDTNAAALHFGLARDLDALPFRADSRLNREIERAARDFKPGEQSFFDAQGLLGATCGAGIAGEELFYEHVHLNFNGNYLLGLAWAQRAEQLLKLTAPASGSWAPQEICERRLGLSDWNRAGVIENVLRRLGHEPLSSQANNARRLELFRSQLKQLRQARTPESVAAARQLFQEALARDPRDHRLRENFAEFLEAVGDLDQTIAEWQQVAALLPHHHVAYFQAGRVLARRGRFDAAETELRSAVALRPDLTEGWVELGIVALGQNRPAQSLEFLDLAGRQQPTDARVCYYRAKALLNLKRRDEALQQYREAVRLNPAYWEALYALGEELAFAGQQAEAEQRFQEVLKLKPDHSMAHLNLGVCLVKAGRVPAGVQEFEAALQADPNNKLAREYLAKVK